MPGATSVGGDLFVQRIDGAAEVRRLDRGQPPVSPDGRWLLFVSTEAGDPPAVEELTVVGDWQAIGGVE
jgi:hypothetical protein